MTLDISQKVRTDLRDAAGATSSRKPSLDTVEPRGALPAQRGVGGPRKAEVVGGGGIAGPLTERNRPDGRADREYYPDGVAYYSNDYMLAVLIQPLRQLNMIDAEGRDVPFIFRVPRDV